MLDPIKLNEYKKDNWFVCAVDDGVVASGRTVKDVLSKFSRSSATFVRPKEYMFTENTSDSRLEYYIYGDIKLLKANGFSLEGERNTWDKNLGYESYQRFLKKDKEVDFVIPSLAPNMRQDVVTFYYPHSVRRLADNENYLENSKFFSDSGLLSDLFDFSDRTNRLIDLLDSQEGVPFDDNVFSDIKRGVEMYVSLLNSLYFSAKTVSLSEFNLEYRSVVAYWAYEVSVALSRVYSETRGTVGSDGAYRLDVVFNDSLSSVDKSFLLDSIKTIDGLCEPHRESFSSFAVLGVAILLHSFTLLKKQHKSYKWAKERLPNNKEYLKRTYAKLGVCVKNLEDSYHFLSSVHSNFHSDGLSKLVVGLALLSTVFDYMQRELQE